MMSRVFFMLVALTCQEPALATTLPDLTGSQYVTHGICTFNDEPITCIEVEKEGKHYVIFHVERKIIGIYRVKDGAERPYFPEDMEQVYPIPGVQI